MEVRDIAWLAGLLEGEGWFGVQASGGYRNCLVIRVQMTDRDVVARAAELLGGKLYGPHGPYGQSKLATYQTAIYASDAAAWMMTLWSLLGERRRAKIEALLADWKTKQFVNPNRPIKCRHPERDHFARGLCRSCYSNEYQKERRRRYAHPSP